MKRILEIIKTVRIKYPNDEFFPDFENSCRQHLSKRKAYEIYNRALMKLDDNSWETLKEKALQQYLNHRNGQMKQGFFNQLNEAFAYRYLASKGFMNVRFLPEQNCKTPDIEFYMQRTKYYCEVKTLGISDEAINRRKTRAVYDGSIYVYLTDGFFNKFHNAVEVAWQQIRARDQAQDGLVFIIIEFDDFVLDHYSNYKKQLIKFSTNKKLNNLFIKIGLNGNRRIIINHNLPSRELY